MTKTKQVIREILEHRDSESLRSMSRNDLFHYLLDNFYVSSGVARNVCNNLKTYDSASLYFIYFPELR